MRLHRARVKKRSNKIGQIAVIRHRARPDKCKDWPVYIIGPFSVWPYFVSPPLPSLSPSSAGIVPLTPSNILDSQACGLISHKVFICMQFPDSPSVRVTDEVYFLSLSPLSLSGRFMSLYIFFMVSPFSL